MRLLFSFVLQTISTLHIEHTNQLHYLWSMEYRALKYNVVVMKAFLFQINLVRDD